MLNFSKTFCLLAACTLMNAATAAHFANGIKIGEVDQNSAIVWTRLTRDPAIHLDGLKFLPSKNKTGPAEAQLPEGKTLDDMVGAVPGTAGEVRISWGGPDGTQETSA